jgi:hypothetical protein
MVERTDSEVQVTPYLSRFAVSRTGGTDISGFYSAEEAMWVVETTQGTRPIIDFADSALELVTKTAAQVEKDDDKHLFALELATKTDSAHESDDKSAYPSFLLELSTKTFAQLESDDTRLGSNTFM